MSIRVLVCLGLALCVGCDEASETDEPAPIDVGEIDGGVEGDVAPPEPDAAPPELDAAPPEPDAAPPGLAVLGNETHSIDSVAFDIIGRRRDGLKVPRDLAFNQTGDELWVINRADDSTVTYFRDEDGHFVDPVKKIDPAADHFMEEASSLAFGAPGTFATCQESHNTYNNQAPGNDFMGPSLWPSDLEVYGISNPNAVGFLGYDLGSHLDMLHESPLCMGITWEADNAYWVFEGMTSSIARVDFHADHGVGFDDHSDGEILRYAVGEVSRVPDVPSHLELDRETGVLYISDTGNSRVAALDTTVGTPGRSLQVKEPGTTLRLMRGEAPVETLFESPELVLPSGIAQFGDLLFVTDTETSRIWGLTLDGEVVDYLDTELPEGSLMGIDIDEEGTLYVVDSVRERVLRIRAK